MFCSPVHCNGIGQFFNDDDEVITSLEENSRRLQKNAVFGQRGSDEEDDPHPFGKTKRGIKASLNIEGKVLEESNAYTAKLDCTDGSAVGMKIFLMGGDDSADNSAADLAVWKFALSASLDARSIATGACCGAPDARSLTFSEKKSSLSPRLFADDCIIGTISEVGAVDKWNSTCPESQVICTSHRVCSVDGDAGNGTKLVLKISKAQKTNQEINLILQRPRKIRLKLQKMIGEPLGMVFRYIDAPFGLLISGLRDGLIQDWNSENPSLAVKVGDRILSVNGRETQLGGAEKVIEILQSEMDVELVILSWPQTIIDDLGPPLS
jgi:hypothetical protein